MAFPTAYSFVASFAILLIGAPIAYTLSRALKLHPRPITIADPKKEATMVFLVAIAVFAAILVWRAIIIPTFQVELLPVDVVDILWISFFSAMALFPVALAMKSTGQSLQSLGVNKDDLWRKLALGFILSLIFVVIIGFVAPSMGGGLASFTPSLAYGVIYVAIISTAEEFVWRGYIQTRIVAYGGTIKGYVGASLIESALWHFPVRYFGQYAGIASEALASTLIILPVVMLFGYIMLRSQNIFSSSVFRFFYNWSVAVLFQLPSI